jgi:hypothetical protein
MELVQQMSDEKNSIEKQLSDEGDYVGSNLRQETNSG